MKRLYISKLAISILICLGLAFIFFAEMQSVAENPSEYIQLYNISSDSSEWKYKSIPNFQNWNMAAGILSLIYVALQAFGLFPKRVLYKQIIVTIDIMLLIVCAYNFLNWYLAGFDH